MFTAIRRAGDDISLVWNFRIAGAAPPPPSSLQFSLPVVVLGRLATTIDCRIDRHRSADFNAGLGAGNINKARAIHAA
jgi:hypothetical protein